MFAFLSATSLFHPPLQFLCPSHSLTFLKTTLRHPHPHLSKQPYVTTHPNLSKQPYFIHIHISQNNLTSSPSTSLKTTLRHPHPHLSKQPSIVPAANSTHISINHSQNYPLLFSLSPQTYLTFLKSCFLPQSIPFH